MKALEVYTYVLAVLSAALLLVAAGLAKKQLVWETSEGSPGATPPAPVLELDVGNRGFPAFHGRRFTRVAPRPSGRGRHS